jgi:S1-C subfamily serine protease
VRGVEEATPAGRAVIERGDLIVAAGDRPITRVDALFDALDAAGPDGSLSLGIVRGTDERDVVVSLEAA